MNPAIPATLVQSPAASDKVARIQVVDALRGFALFGIFLVHCAQWYAAGALPGSVYQAHAGGADNGVAQTIIGIFFDGKFFTFFSFLFGLSFALMLTRSSEPSRVFYGRFAWRLVILGAIGFLHHLQWRGDILSIFAMLGFVMLPFGRVPTKVVLIIAVLLVANLPIRIQAIYETYINPPASTQQPATNYEQEAQTYYKVVKQGSYADMAVFNLNAFDDKMRFQFDSGRIYVTLGFFLLGLYAGRRRLFQQLDEYRPFFRRLTKFSGFTVLGITAVGIALFVVYGGEQRPPKIVELVFGGLYDIHSALMTVFYVSGLTLLFGRQSWQGVVLPLASVGKMGLTSYVLQTIIGTFIFFGYGFGLLGEIDLWQAALLTIPIFVAQVVFSRWWLSRFQYGPLEWLWRSLTYLKTQPMRVQQIASL